MCYQYSNKSILLEENNTIPIPQMYLSMAQEETQDHVVGTLHKRSQLRGVAIHSTLTCQDLLELATNDIVVMYCHAGHGAQTK